jgi:antitoxin VapB
MALNSRTEQLTSWSRELASATGESITTAVTIAVRERLERVRDTAPAALRKQEIMRIARRAASRPVLDRRSAEEIVGYDDDGLPA